MLRDEIIQEWNKDHQAYFYTIILKGEFFMEFHEKYLKHIKIEGNTVTFENIPSEVIEGFTEFKEKMKRSTLGKENTRKNISRS